MHIINNTHVLDLKIKSRSDSLSGTSFEGRFSDLDVVMLSNHEQIQGFFLTFYKVKITFPIRIFLGIYDNIKHEVWC